MPTCLLTIKVRTFSPPPYLIIIIIIIHPLPTYIHTYQHYIIQNTLWLNIYFQCKYLSGILCTLHFRLSNTILIPSKNNCLLNRKRRAMKNTIDNAIYCEKRNIITYYVCQCFIIFK